MTEEQELIAQREKAEKRLQQIKDEKAKQTAEKIQALMKEAGMSYQVTIEIPTEKGIILMRATDILKHKIHVQITY